MYLQYEEIVSLFEVKKENKNGDCYVANGRAFINDLGHKDDHFIVHGEVSGQGNLKGISFGHCWIENEDTVYDYSNGSEKILPKFLYYALGDINYLNNYFKYSLEEYLEKLEETHTWGPWDLKTKY